MVYSATFIPMGPYPMCVMAPFLFKFPYDINFTWKNMNWTLIIIIAMIILLAIA